MTTGIRQLLKESAEAIVHDKEKLSDIWKCKVSCLKCRIGAVIRLEKELQGGESDGK